MKIMPLPPQSDGCRVSLKYKRILLLSHPSCSIGFLNKSFDSFCEVAIAVHCVPFSDKTISVCKEIRRGSVDAIIIHAGLGHANWPINFALYAIMVSHKLIFSLLGQVLFM